MNNFLNPTDPVRYIITGPSECGTSVFVTNLIIDNIKEFEKISIYSPSVHQELSQKSIKCFQKHTIPIDIKPNKIIIKDIDLVTDETIKDEDFEQSGTEMETFDSIEELKHPQKNEDGSVNILYDWNKKEMVDPRKQAMFKRFRQNISSILPYSVRNTTNYQNGLLELMVVSIIYSNQKFWIMTKDLNKRWSRLGLDSFIIPDTDSL